MIGLLIDAQVVETIASLCFFSHRYLCVYRVNRWEPFLGFRTVALRGYESLGGWGNHFVDFGLHPG